MSFCQTNPYIYIYMAKNPKNYLSLFSKNLKYFGVLKKCCLILQQVCKISKDFDKKIYHSLLI